MNINMKMQRITIAAAKAPAKRYSPRTVITWRDFIVRGSCFWEKYVNVEGALLLV